MKEIFIGALKVLGLLAGAWFIVLMSVAVFQSMWVMTKAVMGV